ncbi:hypothetical protein [Rhodohalobacter halophilus]|uniref:hypothetical protein n=1 Tax=Rhodohalobacter halophilus TaxID=1812810 RepID=UPI00083FC296|nr:hypothetical protein [Rhodohalobacter halophilus]
MDHKAIITIFVMGLILLGGCNQASEKNNDDVFRYTNSVDIEYGSDICSYTNDVIETVRYGGKITMKDGTVHKFMSAECVAGFYLEMDDKDEIEEMVIVDFAHGQQYLPVEDLVYLKSSLRPSPNGMSLTAIDNSNEKMKDYIYDAYPGEFHTWEEVLAMVSSEWSINYDEMKASVN